MRYLLFFTNGSVIEQWAETSEEQFISTHSSDPTLAKIIRKKDNVEVWTKAVDNK